MSKHLTVTAANGVTFNVTFGRRLPKYDERPVVSFYDAGHLADPMSLGQFVADYYPETLAEHKDGRFGLNLQGGVDAWTVDAATMVTVAEWVQRQVQNEPVVDEVTSTERLERGDLITVTVDGKDHDMVVSYTYTDNSIAQVNSRTVLAHLRPGGYSVTLRNDNLRKYNVRRRA